MPYCPEDANQVLADFGEDLVCAAAPEVTRGLLDDEVEDNEVAGKPTSATLLVLKVRRGAFAGIAYKGSTVTVPGRGKSFRIERELPRQQTLFDYYSLQELRPRP